MTSLLKDNICILHNQENTSFLSHFETQTSLIVGPYMWWDPQTKNTLPYPMIFCEESFRFSSREKKQLHHWDIRMFILSSLIHIFPCSKILHFPFVEVARPWSCHPQYPIGLSGGGSSLHFVLELPSWFSCLVWIRSFVVFGIQGGLLCDVDNYIVLLTRNFGWPVLNTWIILVSWRVAF